MMIQPALLSRGDKIMIVAPSRKVQPADIEPAIKIFRSWGLEVVTGKNIHSHAHPYLAGTDSQRLHDLQEAINDPSVKAIVSARGGYGSTRIIDLLDMDQLIRQPKWIVGFSDITALHLKLVRHGIMSIHGIMPILFSKDRASESIESLRRVLFEGHFTIASPGHDANRVGLAHGRVIGGNISLILDSLGTASELDPSGKILIIEEIDEYRYRLDRMMTQLRRAGKLEKLAGLVVGHMTDIKDPEPPFGDSVEEIILHAVREYSYPVAFGFPSGHEQPNLAWIQGELAVLAVSEETRLSASLLS
ncbi:MAG TPA: LD-carboxypeptidase [Chryseosolibacter sp.]|nr:LD-carboxypeptidase [Chryseosolibacter sp.]